MFAAKQSRTVHEDSVAYSLYLHSDRGGRGIHTGWPASQNGTKITHAIILTDSINLQQKVGSSHMHIFLMPKKYCGSAALTLPETEAMKEQTCWQASTDIAGSPQLVRAEVLVGSRNFLNADRPQHHSIGRPK